MTCVCTSDRELRPNNQMTDTTYPIPAQQQLHKSNGIEGKLVVEISRQEISRQTGLALSRRSSSRIEGEFALPLICDDLLAGLKGTESAGINRHIVGDARALVRRLNRRGVVNERVIQ